MTFSISSKFPPTQKMDQAANLRRSNLRLTQDYHTIPIQHDCKFVQPKNYLQQQTDCISTLLRWIVASNTHPETRKFYKSEKCLNNEVKRQIFGENWYIIHPYSKIRWQSGILIKGEFLIYFTFADLCGILWWFWFFWCHFSTFRWQFRSTMT